MSVSTSVTPDKDSVYFQGSLTQVQSRQYTALNRDNLTFFEFIKTEPKKQSYHDLTEFDNIIKNYSFPSNKYIYKKIIDEARVIPDDPILKNQLDGYYSSRMYKNIWRIYQNSPNFFYRLFHSTNLGEGDYKQYSIYIYCLCLIEYIMKNHGTEEFKLIRDYQVLYTWALPKYSETIGYIIKGPLSKSSTVKIDFRRHYNAIMNPSNVEENDITSTLQLASLQNLDSKLSMLTDFLAARMNSYDKLPDQARTYNLVIDTKNINCYTDSLKNNTLMVDLRNSDFGDTDSTTSKDFHFDDKVGQKVDITSRLTLHRLQTLFMKYSRFRIVNMFVDKFCYVEDLKTFNVIEVHFQGINLSTRNVTLVNSIDSNIHEGNSEDLIINCHVSEETENGYKLMQDNDIITYHPDRVRVTDAKIYLTDNAGRALAHAGIIDVPLSIYNIWNIYVRTRSSVDNLGLNVLSATLINFANYDLNYSLHEEDYGFVVTSDGRIAYFGSGIPRLYQGADWLSSTMSLEAPSLMIENNAQNGYFVQNGAVYPDFFDFTNPDDDIRNITKMNYYWSLFDIIDEALYETHNTSTTTLLETNEDLAGCIIRISSAEESFTDRNGITTPNMDSRQIVHIYDNRVENRPVTGIRFTNDSIFIDGLNETIHVDLTSKRAKIAIYKPSDNTMRVFNLMFADQIIILRNDISYVPPRSEWPLLFDGSYVDKYVNLNIVPRSYSSLPEGLFKNYRVVQVYRNFDPDDKSVSSTYPVLYNLTDINDNLVQYSIINSSANKVVFSGYPVYNRSWYNLKTVSIPTLDLNQSYVINRLNYSELLFTLEFS